MAFKVKLTYGDRVWYDGDTHKVEGFGGGVITLRSRSGRLSSMTPSALMSAKDFKLLDKGDYGQQDLGCVDISPQPDESRGEV